MAFWDDVRKNIGNFGRDVSRNVNDFFVDTEEEKRRRREQQAQQRAAQQKQNNTTVTYQQSTPQPGSVTIAPPPKRPPVVIAKPPEPGKVEIGTPEVRKIETGTILDKQRADKKLSQYRAFVAGVENGKRDALTDDDIEKARRERKKNEIQQKIDSNPLSIFVRGIDDARKQVVAAPVNFVNDTFVKPAIKSLDTLGKQAETSVKAQQKGYGGINSQKMADAFKKFVDEDVRSGLLSKEQADKRKADIQEKFEKAQKALKDAEKETGTKFDQNKGVMAAGETALNFWGLPTLAKNVAVNNGKQLLDKGNKFFQKDVGEVIEAGQENATKVIDATKKGVEDGVELAKDKFEEVKQGIRDNVAIRREEEVMRKEAEANKPVNPERDARIAERNKVEEPAVVPENEPAYMRSRREAEARQRAALEPTVETPREKTALEIRQEKEQALRDADTQLNEAINSDPTITPEQQVLLRDSVREKLEKTLKAIDDSQVVVRAAIQKEIDDNAARIAGVQDEVAQAQANAADDVAPNIETTAPQDAPGTAPDPNTPPVTPEPEVPVDPVKRFNEEAGIKDEVNDIDYVQGQQSMEKMAGNKTMEELTGRQMGRIPAAVNNKTQGKVANVLSNFAGRVGGKMLTSQNPIANFMGQTAFGFNKKSTMTNIMKQMVEQVSGRRGGMGNLQDDIVRNLEEPIAKLGDEGAAVAKENVYKSFELYNNGQIDEALEVLKRFTPEERAYFDNVRELNLLRNNLNRSTMDTELIDNFANGMHMPRIIDMKSLADEMGYTGDQGVEEMLRTWAMMKNRTLDLNPNRQRKQLEELSEEVRNAIVRDPAQASTIRAEIALHNKAVSDFASQVRAIPGAVVDTPARGYLPVPDQKRYGDLAGKFIRRDLGDYMLTGNERFKSETYKAVSTILDKYQTSWVGKIENSLRKILTVYNPATRLGNRGANLTQGSMAGFNVPEMLVQQQHYINVLKNGGDEWTRLAQTFGAIDDNRALGRISGIVTDPKNKFLKRATDSYTDIDTAAKVAMFQWQIRKGASPEQAARFVNRALPNIGNSGEVYSFFSRLPVLGVPFRAVQPEVMRSLASTATRNTAPFITAMTAYTTFQNFTWEGVPDEERKQIQERFGSGQTPFAGINRAMNEAGIPSDLVLPSSWSFNAGGLFGTDPETGEQAVVDVDPRRLLGMYSINLGGETAADSIIDQALKVSPAPIPVSYDDGELKVAPQNFVGSRVFGPLYQAMIDRDFRGKSIQDPEGKIYDGMNMETKFVNPETGQPETQSDPLRLGEFLARSYVPQIGDVLNVGSSVNDEENFFGQKMNPMQAMLRFVGLKGEEFDKERLKDMTSTSDFFKEMEQIEKEVEGMPPAGAEAYKRLTGYAKLREQVDNEFKPGEKRWKKAPVYDWSEDKWKDLAARPELYEVMKNKKQRELANDGKPLPPEYDDRLSESFRKQLIQNKTVAPGDDAELDQRMYASPEWDYYQKLEDEYKEKSKKYYPESGDDFVDELVKNQDEKFPKKPATYKAYGEAYAKFAKGETTQKPEFTDAVKAEKEAYTKETWAWTNRARKARGLPAIDYAMWSNSTFGYDTSPGYSGSSWGGGGGGGGGGGSDKPNDANILSLLSAPTVGEIPFPEASVPQIKLALEKYAAQQMSRRGNVRLGASSRGQG